MTKTKERPPLSLDDLAERYAALGAEIAAAPEKLISLGAALAREAARHGDKPAVILTSGDVRRHLRSLLEPELPEVAVLAAHELAPGTRVETAGRIAV